MQPVLLLLAAVEPRNGCRSLSAAQMQSYPSPRTEDPVCAASMPRRAAEPETSFTAAALQKYKLVSGGGVKQSLQHPGLGVSLCATHKIHTSYKTPGLLREVLNLVYTGFAYSTFKSVFKTLFTFKSA